ncbi:MAG TPA: tetratricopeptide repeat protein [Methylomirabilota bacterium]|nr:tetratricopeptide repeat protein [Methylomirabilota bacterium]
MMEDRYGLPLSSSSPRAVDAYRRGVDCVLLAVPGAERAFQDALDADPGFALAAIGLARTHQIFGRLDEARAAGAAARGLVGGVTRRERRHVEAIGTLLDGNAAGALAAVRAHVAECPRDALVLSLAVGAFGLIAFSGRIDHNAVLLGLLDELAPHYGDDWWFAFAHGWAFNEARRPVEARTLVEHSLARQPRSANAAHALAHVCYETGAVDEGTRFLEGWLPGYERASTLHCHLSWHLALFELARGRIERALEVYEDAIAPGASQAPPLNTLSDSAALLWRLGLYGEPTPAARWARVAEFAARAFPRPGLAFADIHVALAHAGHGDTAALTRIVEAFREADRAGRLPAGPGAAALAEGLGAFAAGDYPGTIARIAPIAGEVIRLGGSHAQRDVFEETLIQAYLRSGRGSEAAALLRRRLERRPSGRDRDWLARAA